MRTTRPEAGNKYYITRANGGYSYAIKKWISYYWYFKKLLLIYFGTYYTK